MYLDDRDYAILTVYHQAEIAPSYRELGAAVGISYSTAATRAARLIAGGLLHQRARGLARAIQITSKGREVLDARTARTGAGRATQ